MTRDQCETVQSELQSQGFPCAYYHAGMTVQNRKKVHEDFLFDRVKCIAATVAFGMGVDKSNVRYVIHYGAPKSPEARVAHFAIFEKLVFAVAW